MTLFFGIDVSKDTLDLACHGAPLVQRFANTPRGIAALVRTVKDATLVVFESSSTYHRPLAERLVAAGVPVSMPNPQWVKDFTRSRGRRAKTDAQDAQHLAHYAAVHHAELRPWCPPSPQREALRALVGLRRTLVADATRLKNQLEGAHPSARPALQRLLSVCQEEIQQAEKAIQAQMSQEDLVTSLAPMKGVGTVLLSTLLAELPELGTLTSKQAAALAGLAPYTRQSGRWTGRAFCHGGRRVLRTALYMSALTASQHNPQIAPFYRALLARGKDKKLALTACARKLLVILNARVRDSLRPPSDATRLLVA